MRSALEQYRFERRLRFLALFLPPLVTIIVFALVWWRSRQ